jgi:hypothetical protein
MIVGLRGWHIRPDGLPLLIILSYEPVRRLVHDTSGSYASYEVSSGARPPNKL